MYVVVLMKDFIPVMWIHFYVLNHNLAEEPSQQLKKCQGI